MDTLRIKADPIVDLIKVIILFVEEGNILKNYHWCVFEVVIRTNVLPIRNLMFFSKTNFKKSTKITHYCFS